MSGFQNSPGPISPDSAPGPKQAIISLLLKTLAAIIALIIAALAAFLFIYLPSSYMKHDQFPVHMKWRATTEKEVSQAASKIFQETDQEALAQGFHPVMTYIPWDSEYYKPEAKLYLSEDARTALTEDCFWYGPKIYCKKILNTFFENGVEVVTTNIHFEFNEPEPPWRQIHDDPNYANLEAQYRDHLNYVDKAVKGGGVPVLLTPENAEATATGFQDKTNKWRSEHGLLQIVPGLESYQPTYHAALNRVLITFKLRSVSK